MHPEQPATSRRARGASARHVDDGAQTRASGCRRYSPAAERREVEEARIKRFAGGGTERTDIGAETTPPAVDPAASDTRSAAGREPPKLGANPAVPLDKRPSTTRTAVRNGDEFRTFRQSDCNTRVPEVERRTASDRMRRRVRHGTSLRGGRVTGRDLRRRCKGEQGSHQHDAESELRHVPTLRRRPVEKCDSRSSHGSAVRSVPRTESSCTAWGA